MLFLTTSFNKKKLILCFKYLKMDFEYITLNIPSVGVSLENFEQNLIGCECKNGECTIQNNCSCLKMSGHVYFIKKMYIIYLVS